jgi:hypothetical protein
LQSAAVAASADTGPVAGQRPSTTATCRQLIIGGESRHGVVVLEEKKKIKIPAGIPEEK